MKSNLKDHSYEEIWSAALDVLYEREKVQFTPNQYRHISKGVAEVLARRDGMQELDPELSSKDEELFMDVFWTLFQQGIIILGYNQSNMGFPWCKLSNFGRRAENQHGHRLFHDVSSYEKQIRSQIPTVSDITLLYLREAMQAFRSGCLLSATVMLGVAAEHSFLTMLERVEKGPNGKDFQSAIEQSNDIK